MKKQTGFTLIELLVVITIFVILATMAAPNLRNYNDNNRRTANINSLVSALNLARSEAVKIGANVTVCAREERANAGDPDPLTCNDTNLWHGGWLVFVDDPTTVQGTYEAGTDELIRVFDPVYLTPTIDLAKIRMAELNNQLYVTYNGSGFANSTFDIVRCDQPAETTLIRNQRARAIIINNTGRVRLSEDSDSNKIHETSDGNDIDCLPLYP